MLFVPHNASDMVGFYLCGPAKSPLDTRANNNKNRHGTEKDLELPGPQEGWVQ